MIVTVTQGPISQSRCCSSVRQIAQAAPSLPSVRNTLSEAKPSGKDVVLLRRHRAGEDLEKSVGLTAWWSVTWECECSGERSDPAEASWTCSAILWDVENIHPVSFKPDEKETFIHRFFLIAGTLKRNERLRRRHIYYSQSVLTVHLLLVDGWIVMDSHCDISMLLSVTTPLLLLHPPPPPTEPGNDLTKEVLLGGGAVEWVDQPVPFRVIWGLLLLEGVVASAPAHTHSNRTGTPMPMSQCKWPNTLKWYAPQLGGELGLMCLLDPVYGPNHCTCYSACMSFHKGGWWSLWLTEEVLKTHVCPWDHLSSRGSKLKHLSCSLPSFSLLNGGMKTEKSEFKTHKSFMCDQTLKFRIFWASSESLCLFSCSPPAFCSACVFPWDVLLWNAFPFFDRLR